MEIITKDEVLEIISPAKMEEILGSSWDQILTKIVEISTAYILSRLPEGFSVQSVKDLAFRYIRNQILMHGAMTGTYRVDDYTSLVDERREIERELENIVKQTKKYFIYGG